MMMKNKQKWWWWGGLVVVSAAVSWAVFAWRGRVAEEAGRQEVATADLGQSVASDSGTVQPAPLPDPLKPVSFLVLGYGGAGHDGGYLSDTMMWVKVLPEEKRILLFSIPRDWWVALPTAGGGAGGYSKINAVYALGRETGGKHDGGNLAKTVVGEMVGEPVDYYLGVDFSGFKKSLTTLAGANGLVVEVPYTFTDSFYPLEGKKDDDCGYTGAEIASLTAQYSGYQLEKQFGCRYEEISYQQGRMTLTAEEALKFVRSRHSDVGGSDFARSQRQQALIKAVRDEVLTPTFLLKVPSLFSNLSKTVTTDVSITYLTKAITNYGDVREFALESYVLDPTNVLTEGRSRDRQYILLPRAGQDNYEEVQAWIGERVKGGEVAGS